MRGFEEGQGGDRDLAGATVASLRDQAQNDSGWGASSEGYLQEDFIETFRRYIPKAEVEELKAELGERTVGEKVSQVETPAAEGMRVGSST